MVCMLHYFRLDLKAHVLKVLGLKTCAFGVVLVMAHMSMDLMAVALMPTDHVFHHIVISFLQWNM